MGWINANAVARRGLLEDLMFALKANAAYILDEDIKDALLSTIEENGKTIGEDALETNLRAMERYGSWRSD